MARKARPFPKNSYIKYITIPPLHTDGLPGLENVPSKDRRDWENGSGKK